MKAFILALLTILFIFLSPAPGVRGDDTYFEFSVGSRHHRPHHSYNYGYYPHGYYYDRHEAYHGSYERGYGAHVPTGSAASPYFHGTHHGYHWSEEEGWHRGTHYGHM